MSFLRQKLSASPVVARVAPFVVFVLLTVLQEKFGEPARYWLYLVKCLVGAWFLFEMRGLVPEMKWRFSVDAVVIGVAVFIVWVGLDPFFWHLPTKGLMWNPHSEFGDNSGRAWFFIIVRVMGMTLVVPPLEEVFFRSFLYRFISEKNFLALPLGVFRRWPFIITAVLFGFEHSQWLAGVLAGVAYQWLVVRKDRIGDAITAHAITNLLLGLWVVWKSAWQFF